MDKYNKKCLVFFFAPHFFTGHDKRHGLVPVLCRTMAEKERKEGSHWCSGRTMKAAQASLAAARPTFVEDQGAAWTAKELRARDSSGSVPTRPWAALQRRGLD
jgi:hypothetical protein